MINTLQHTQFNTRVKAAQALGEIGPGASNAVPELVKAIDDEEVQVWLAAIAALVDIGPQAVPTVPKMIEKLVGENDFYDVESANALKQITSQDYGQDADAWQQWWQSQP